MSLRDALQQIDDETFNQIIRALHNECSRFPTIASEDCPLCQIKFGLERLRTEKPKAEAA